MDSCTFCHRRRFLQLALAGSAAFFTHPGAFAEQLLLTPKQTEGPFYPDKLPLDTDNDLLVINDSITPAVGEITHLSGVIMDQKAQPIPGALIEIWQTDQHGNYIHSRGGDQKTTDRNFQGYGRFLTDQLGRYYFRTIKPSPYTGRTPHIHIAVSKNNQRLLTTQCYIDGIASNDNDVLYRRLDEAQRKFLTAAFLPLEGSALGELRAELNLVIGLTPQDS